MDLKRSILRMGMGAFPSGGVMLAKLSSDENEELNEALRFLHGGKFGVRKIHFTKTAASDFDKWVGPFDAQNFVEELMRNTVEVTNVVRDIPFYDYTWSSPKGDITVNFLVKHLKEPSGVDEQHTGDHSKCIYADIYIFEVHLTEAEVFDSEAKSEVKKKFYDAANDGLLEFTKGLPKMVFRLVFGG